MDATYGLRPEPLGKLFSRETPEQMDSGLAKSSAMMKSARSGGSLGEALQAGAEAQHSYADPLFQLKKLEFQARINENAAQAANHIRTLQAHQIETEAEQSDRNNLMQISVEKKGNIPGAMEALAGFTAKSALGLKMVSDQVDALVKLRATQNITRIVAGSSAAALIKASVFEPGGKDWMDSLLNSKKEEDASEKGSPDVVIKLQEELKRKKADKNADPAEIKAIENRISRMSANDETKLASKIKELEALKEFRYDAMSQQSLVTLQRSIRDDIIKKKATIAELQSGKKMDTEDAKVVERGLKSLEGDLAEIESSLSKRRSGKAAPASPAPTADSTPATATEPAKPAAASRVRVKGPDGKTGSVPAGTKLPQGWTFE